MNKAKRKMLEKKGWKVGTAEEFLGLSPVESRYIELKFALSKYLRVILKKVFYGFLSHPRCSLGNDVPEDARVNPRALQGGNIGAGTMS